MNINEIKEGFLSFYKDEYQKAWVDGDQKRAHRLEGVVSLFRPVTTKSEFLQLLLTEPTMVFQSMKDWRPMVAYIREKFSEQDLQVNGIYLDVLPKKGLSKETQYLFVNSQPTLCEYAFSTDAQASFLGRWLVDVYQAEVVALDGAHINLRGPMAMGEMHAENASITPRHDIYFQLLMTLGGPKFRMVEQMALSKTPVELLCEILDNQEVLQKPIMLRDIQATPIMEKGDQLITDSGHFALIRNEYKREYVLLRKLTEQKVIDIIQSTKNNLCLTSDVRALHVCMIRDMFLRLPNERFVIGVNQLGKTASLSFDANKHCFNTHGLYYKDWNDNWVEEGRIYIEEDKTFQENINAIREAYKGDLSSGIQRETKRSAKR